MLQEQGFFSTYVRWCLCRGNEVPILSLGRSEVSSGKEGQGAISIQCSKTATVIGHCPEGGQQGNTNKGVLVIADLTLKVWTYNARLNSGNTLYSLW